MTTLAPLSLVVAAAILGWDLVLAGWMATQRRAPRSFLTLTSACGLLVAPALAIAVASGTEDGARTVSGIAWLFPLLCVAFAMQLLYAIAARLVSPVVALPILLYDIVVAAVATGDFLVAHFGHAPVALQAAVAARDVVIGITVGRTALVTPYVLLVPMIAPTYGARWRLSATVRALMTLVATASTTLLVIEWPRGIGAVRSYERARTANIHKRDPIELAVGTRLFPELDGPPRARTIAADRALATQLSPDIVLVVLNADAISQRTLDSLAATLAPYRADSVRIAIALRMGVQSAASYDIERARAIALTLATLAPDVLFPAYTDPIASPLAATPPTTTWWRVMMHDASLIRDRVRPATQLGVVLSRLDARDSALYAWAVTAPHVVNIIAATIYPSYSGLSGVEARLRALDRWHASTLDARPNLDSSSTHWLATVGGLPHAHGDASQFLSIRQSIAWASERLWVRAVIVGEPADYRNRIGMRAANGRIRSAWPALAADIAAMRAGYARPRTTPSITRDGSK